MKRLRNKGFPFRKAASFYVFDTRFPVPPQEAGGGDFLFSIDTRKEVR